MTCQHILPHALRSCTPHFGGRGSRASERPGLAFVASHILACAHLDHYTAHLSQHTPGPNRLVYSLSPANTFCLPSSVPWFTPSPLSQQQETSLKFYPKNQGPHETFCSPRRCVFSATCLAHTTARYFYVIVCGVVGWFSMAAHKPLEG